MSDIILPDTVEAANPRFMDELKRCFAEVLADFEASPAMRCIAEGEFTLAFYKEYLRQVFHYTRENPQLLATATSFMRGADRSMVGLLLRHSLEEVGHEAWALRDLEVLGEDVTRVADEAPLPETVALNAFAYYQLTQRNPVAHLGYLYFLEFLPTTCGASYLRALQAIGVPRDAMSFLERHAEIDVGHNRLIARYIHRLVHDERDLAAVQYGMRATARLYARLLDAVMAQARDPRPRGHGWDEARRPRTSRAPA